MGLFLATQAVLKEKVKGNTRPKRKEKERQEALNSP